ncbi:MAG: TerB family tellurite resistance protein [Bacteroidetes bacterium]|nr:TerB family tellurite resistance protein [Bacteroidota bacterium]
MIQEAKKQVEKITVAQIKETLKKIAPDKFDKMIITDGQSLKRGNYLFAILKYQKVERQIKQIKFPLYGAIKDNFAELEGGEGKLGSSVVINSNKLFETLQRNYSISGQGFSNSKVDNPFQNPLDEANGEINSHQRIYFFPDLTFQETCEECRGEKYVKCTDDECDGRHNWTCTDCQGDGKIKCDECSGDGKITCKHCKGSGYVKCGSGASGFLKRNIVGNIAGGGCGGTGYVKDKDSALGERKCKTCHGKGEIPCEDCGTRGEIKCEKCSGRGEIKCNTCSGKGDITCSVCYGDKDRYGKVDCPECKTIGTVAQVVFVESYVTKNEIEKVILKGDKLNITDTNILKHVKPNSITELVFKKVNDKVEEKYDEFSQECADIFEKDLGLSKNNYPLITKEEIYYQVVPCVELSYKHMLTNTAHEFTILDFWNNPEVIFHSEPEVLKQDLGNVTKSVGGFFGKMFKTKGFKTKEDKKNEITLLIHLAKIDGKIEDEEKIFLSDAIGHLDDFTNTEKQKLFDLMNAANLPSLTKNETTFSSKERANEVLENLTKLASADGELEGKEKEFIDNLKSMIG